MFSAKTLLDSISEAGKRLTTFEITFPRIILAEFNTHRMLSKNSASSRAIPFKKQLERIMNDPFIPERFPVNCSGMQPQEYYEPESIKYPGYPTREYKASKRLWLKARDEAVKIAETLVGEHSAANTWWDENDQVLYGQDTFYLNVHKQIVNRLLEPFMWHTVICTATELDNFFKLRTHGDAQAEIRHIADLMYDAYHYYDDKDEDDFSWGVGLDPNLPPPQNLKNDQWHCPLIYEEDHALMYEYTEGHSAAIQEELTKQVSAARCARVSYLTHEGTREIEKDLDLFGKLTKDPLHASPLEHVAKPYHEEIDAREYKYIKDIQENPKHPLNYTYKEMMQISFYNDSYWKLPRIGNFFGYLQYRKEFPNENCTNFRKDV